jgi:murein tripeptide amidase MpaA
MGTPMLKHAYLALLLSVSGHVVAAEDDWRTAAETSGYQRTPRYDESVAYFRRIATAYPDRVRLEPFGKSGEGRPLFVAIASKDGVFDPRGVHASGRAVVLIQNAIHAGEIDGKDASMALLRDMAVTRSRSALLDRAVVLFVVTLNPDGHERFGPYNRINQNGPAEMGWRTNAQNLNLNRDYMKLDTPEIRGLIALFNRWLPDVVVDNHVTDGADYQHAVNHAVESSPDVDREIATWVDSIFRPQLESRASTGTTIARFVTFRDDTDLSKGAEPVHFSPRFASGYFVSQNRPALLVETHMLKDYRTRVIANYETMRATLEIVNDQAAELKKIVRQADARTARGGVIPLRVGFTAETSPWRLRGYRAIVTPSEVSGARWVQWTREPIDLDVPLAATMRPTFEVTMPGAYVVPASFGSVIDVLEAHGLTMQRTMAAWETQAEVYHCAAATFHSSPYEGRIAVTFGTKPVTDVPVPSRLTGATPFVPGCVGRKERVRLPSGSVVVAMQQRAAKVAVHFLEPDGPDSALAWGFFNAMFERKEYGEGYVLEKLAREMLAADPQLETEFAKRLASDAAFADSPAARLDFFYQRSPWWDARHRVYPVVRVASLEGAPLREP